MTVLDRRGFLLTTASAALMAAAPALAQGPEDAKLKTLLDQIFEDQVDESPQRATSLGLVTRDDETGRKIASYAVYLIDG